MEELQISPSQEIFDSVVSNEENNTFYGMGRSKPYVPFIFKPAEGDIFFKNPVPYQNTSITPRCYRKIQRLFTSPNMNYTQSSIAYLVSIAESNMFRVSVTNWECGICHERLTREECIEHIIEKHSQFFSSLIRNHNDIISEEDDGLNNMATKLQFDANAYQPDAGFPTVRTHGFNIAAPCFSVYEDEDDLEEEDSSSSLEAEIYTPPYPDEIPLSPEIERLMSTRDNEYHHLALTDDMHNNSEEVDADAAERLLEPLMNLIAEPFIVKEEPEKPKEEVKVAKPTIAELTPDEIEEFNFVETPRKKNKPKPPKKIPFISTIPEDICDDAIRAIAEHYIANYIDTNITQIVRQPLITKKKEQQKKLRDEREAKKKAEEQKRRNEYRQKRVETIGRMAGIIANPFIREFLRSEIVSIFEDEKKKVIAEEEERQNTEASSGNAPPPILISGLLSYHTYNTEFFKKLFKNCAFATTEDGSPKILYRYNANRFDVLIYLQKMSDVRACIAQSPIFINDQRISLSIESTPPEPAGNVVESFTGQQMTISSSAKNVDLSISELQMLSESSGMCSPDYIIPPS